MHKDINWIFEIKVICINMRRIKYMSGEIT